MASITDLIMQQVKSVAGGAQIPAGLQSSVLEGLSSSVLGSLTQTAARPGGVDLIKSLLSGKTSAAASPVTQLAGKLFSNNVLKGLNLGASDSNSLAGLVPQVMSKLSNVIQDRDGDGDVDLNDILLSLKGGGNAAAGGKGLLGAAAKSILGGILKK